MKIHSIYIPRAIALIDLAIDGLNRIKELIIANKDIQENDWMRGIVPLNELSNLISEQEIEFNYPKCSECIFFSKGISACMYPTNNKVRIIDPDHNSCDNVSLEWNEETKEKLERAYEANMKR